MYDILFILVKKLFLSNAFFCKTHTDRQKDGKIFTLDPFNMLKVSINI